MYKQWKTLKLKMMNRFAKRPNNNPLPIYNNTIISLSSKSVCASRWRRTGTENLMDYTLFVL